MGPKLTRRGWIGRNLLAAAGVSMTPPARAHTIDGERAGMDGRRIAEDAWAFIVRCARDDGAYAPSPDPSYRGDSDTRFSDLAAPTYAAVLARTLGCSLPKPERTIAFLHAHQRPDGRFVNQAGEHDPESDLAVLYNTTQGVVALRALGQGPRHDPLPAVAGLLQGDRYQRLPWYTTSFFPLLCEALGRPFPEEWRDKLAGWMTQNQAEDGYLGDHVAATFHMVHFFRLIGAPIPRADRMVARVLRDQKPDGGWNIREPDWDVHAAFDAVFILRQIGGADPKVRRAIDGGAGWSLGCRNRDGGFGHFPGRHSDMDAVYFQLGTLIQAGKIPGVRVDRKDASTLGWGHAMDPGTK